MSGVNSGSWHYSWQRLYFSMISNLVFPFLLAELGILWAVVSNTNAQPSRPLFDAVISFLYSRRHDLTLQTNRLSWIIAVITTGKGIKPLSSASFVCCPRLFRSNPLQFADKGFNLQLYAVDGWPANRKPVTQRIDKKTTVNRSSILPLHQLPCMEVERG